MGRTNGSGSGGCPACQRGTGLPQRGGEGEELLCSVPAGGCKCGGEWSPFPSAVPQFPHREAPVPLPPMDAHTPLSAGPSPGAAAGPAAPPPSDSARAGRPPAPLLPAPVTRETRSPPPAQARARRLAANVSNYDNPARQWAPACCLGEEEEEGDSEGAGLRRPRPVRAFPQPASASVLPAPSPGKAALPWQRAHELSAVQGRAACHTASPRGQGQGCHGQEAS